jgi:NADH-quinone oxidoreductase subunit G
VRFGEEICGIPELGTIGRGEWMKISTYIEKSIDHELSANIIDLCPVGALNNKPYRYSARAWEMLQHAAVSPHDCVGSNMYVHTLRGTIKRVVPKENEAINETWLSDRDRFSYEGIYSDDRLLAPRVRENGRWRDIAWEEALQMLAEKLQASSGDKTGILASPGATVEEAYLLARLAEGVGSSNIDHRLRRRDFSDQENDPVFPWLGCDLADIETQKALLLVGSNLRREAPILAHRVRKAARKGARVAVVNRDLHHYYFDVAPYLSGNALVDELAGIAVAAAKGKTGGKVPAAVASLCDGVTPGDGQKDVAGMLAGGGLILTGLVAARDADFAAIRALTAAIAELTGARSGFLSEGANSAGAHLAGAIPHRKAGGTARAAAGMNAADMLDAPLDALVLFGIEPERDLPGGRSAVARLEGQAFVAALTPYASADLSECADLLLPIGTFAESAGTFVNCEGRWQSFGGVASPLGEARPGWKVLRVLGNLLNLDGFDYLTSEAVLDELQLKLGNISPDNRYAGKKALGRSSGRSSGRPDDRSIVPDADVPMYEVDAIVRRAVALQLTQEAERARQEHAQQESAA